MINRMKTVEDQNKARKYQKKIYSHQRAISEMLKVIAVTPMDDELKMILRMKIWGIHPKIFAPMTHLAISKELKCKVYDVKRWEEDAIHNVKIYLSKAGLEVASEKFKKEKAINHIVNPQKRIIG